MTNAKITKKDRFASIIDILSVDAAANADLIDFCENEIALLEKKAAKAKETAKAKKADTDELTAAVEAALTDEFASIADITARIEGDDVTSAKVAYRLNALVKAGVAEKQEMTVPGGEGQKSRKIQSYRVAVDAE